MQPSDNQTNNTASTQAPVNNLTNVAQPMQTKIQAASQQHLEDARVNSLQNTYINNIDHQGNYIHPQPEQTTPVSNQNPEQTLQNSSPQNPVQPETNVAPQATPIAQQQFQGQNPQLPPMPVMQNQVQMPNLPNQTAPVMPQNQGQAQVNQPTPNQTNKQKPAKKTRDQSAQEATSQNSLLISEIRDNMIILNDGTFRAVIACDSINYDLMSAEERDGIEYSYQQFLNTLYFPIQIIVQSRAIDLKPYTDKLEQIRSRQENMLLGILMDEYIDFIFDISEQANIMEKNFFIVVPYSLSGEIDSAVNSFKNLSDGVLSSIQKKAAVTINARDYAKVKDEMNNRVNTVVGGLMNMGVRAGRLPTQAISMLYYNFYNPDTALDEPINNFGDYTGFYTRQGEGEARMPGMGV